VSAFYGFELLERVTVLPPIHGAIQAWRAHEGGRDVTLVFSAPQLIQRALQTGDSDSTVSYFGEDLESLNLRTPEPGQLKLIAIRRVEDGRIPIGVFEPVNGWALLDIVKEIQLPVPAAAALVLQIYRTYAGAPNVLRPDGKLARCMLPHFEKVWDDEVPSFVGFEPDISVTGRVKEARDLLESISGHVTKGDYIAHEFERQMTELAAGVDLGAELLRHADDFVKLN